MSHLLENNSTNKPLLANEVFLGSPVLIDPSQITASVSFTTDQAGTLEFLHSQNGRDFYNFEDVFEYYGASHNRQVSLKGLYIRVRYTNGPINQTSFLLFTRLLTTQNDDMNVNVSHLHDSIECYANEGGFDIRSLTAELDSVSVPAIDACITGNAIKVLIQNTSGLNNTNIFDSNGDTITTNENGELRVAGNFNMRYLSSTTDSVSIPALTYAKDAINVSGSSVSVSGSVSVSNQIANYATATNQISTNTKLDTINTTITNKTNNGFIDSIQIYGSNGITNKPFLMDNYQSLNVNPIDDSINDAPFDLLINGPLLWADTTPLNKPFFADLNGRQGWYYDNFNNIANISNIYWYANPVSGSLKENNMAFSSLGSMYAIITCDYVENGELTVPFMGVYSQATGSNDFIPGFAHSRWVFQLNGDNRAKLRKGETILIYTGSTRPNYHINLPAYPLSLVSQNGDCSPLEIIAYMTINTQATTSKIGYLLQYVGYMNLLIGFNREYEFRNSKERLIESNLSASRILVDTGLTSLNVDIGITNIAINNFSELNGLNVEISNGLTILNFPSEISINNGLTINNFPSSVEISNGLTILNFPSEISINNGLTILNFPSEISINNGLTILNFPSEISINNGLTINNFSELDGLSVNTGITGYALENGNLLSIKNNTDKLKYSGDFLKCVISNQGFQTQSYTYNGAGDTRITATIGTLKNGLDVNIMGSDTGLTILNFPSSVQISNGLTVLNDGFKILDDNNNGLGYGTNPLIIDGTVSFPDNSFIGITGLVGITGGIHCQGYDYDTGTYNDIYVDGDGVIRAEIVESHIISARYNIETDADIIARTSTNNPSGNYTVDTRGREGWLYKNSLLDNDLNWYKNSISNPPALTIRKLQSLYAVLCFDVFPTDAFHSYFVITTTAGSIWFYYNSSTLTNKVYPGETTLLFYGNKAFQHFPQIQNASKLEMIRVHHLGTGNLDEEISKIEFHNTQEASLGLSQYLISECGLYDSDRQNWFSVYFRNTIEFDAYNNLSNLQLDANNNLKTLSRVQDSTGNNITSTVVSSSRGLDINVLNTSLTVGITGTPSVSISGTPSVSISGTPSVSISGTPTVNINSGQSININDSSGLAINSSGGLLECKSRVYGYSQSATVEAITSTKSNNYNALDTNLTAYNRTNAIYDKLTTIQPIGSANTRALETYSYTVGLNNSSNLPLPITSSTTDTTQSLDTYINNPMTTNLQSISGINVAPQFMKFRSYNLECGANTGANTVLTANSGNIFDINSAGLISGGSYPKTIFGQITGAGATSKFVMIDYVNSSGVEVIGAPFTITTTATQLLTNVWGVNRVYLATNQVQQQLQSTDTILVYYTQSGITVWTSAIIRAGETQTFITIPNNAIGVITSLTVFVNNVGEVLQINKFSSNGTRQKMRLFQQIPNNSIYTITGNMEDGGICGIFRAGDTIALNTENGTPTFKRASCMVNIVYLT